MEARRQERPQAEYMKGGRGERIDEAAEVTSANAANEGASRVDHNSDTEDGGRPCKKSASAGNRNNTHVLGDALPGSLSPPRFAVCLMCTCTVCRWALTTHALCVRACMRACVRACPALKHEG